MQSLHQIQILPPQSQGASKQTSTASLQRTAWIANRISRLISAYRRDDYADPESFVAQAGTVLEAYEDHVIEHVTSPSTGIQRTNKFAPLIPEIIEACEARLASIKRQRDLDEWAERKRKSDEAKARTHSTAPNFGPNLFVPDGSRNYDKMAARAQAEPARARFDTRTCQDGIIRSGVWVPLSWWEEPRSKNGEAA